MKQRLTQSLAFLLAAAFIFVNAVPAYDVSAAEPSKEGAITIVEGSNGTTVEADEQLATVTLRNTGTETATITEYNLGVSSSLSIAAGDSLTISAPDIYAEDGNAYKLAVIADGTEVPLESGTISGEITVCIVEGVRDYYVSHGQETVRWITCAVYADENGVDPKYSLLPMVAGVAEGDTTLSDITIISNNKNTAAIRSGGTGTLTVNGANVTLVGDGGDDFTGIGAALGAADTSTLTINDANIYTAGIIRCAIFAGDEATLNLTKSKVQCEPGEYQQSVSISTAGMASPPSGLGIWGNCRAMNMVDAANVNITDCEIISQNWGALGVDDVTDGHLNVKDSKITLEEQGYGAYAIGKCVDVFDNCTFNINYGVVAYAAAGDGSELILTGGSIANSLNYYGFVTHQSFNGDNSKITVTGEGTELHAGLGGIIAKGRGADITISGGAVVTANSGVLVRAQVNDDTGAGEMDGTEVVNVLLKDTTLTGDIVQGMGAPYDASGDASADALTSAPVVEASASGDSGPMGPMGPMGPGGPGGGNSITESTMNVTLDSATLTGAISSAELTLAIDDGNISFDNIKDVGVVTNTVYTANEYATLNVTLQNGSIWAVTEPSYLMSLTVDETSKITGASVYVDGKVVTLEAGKTYTGNIVVTGEEVTVAAEPKAPGTPMTTKVIIGLCVLALVLAGVLVALRKK